MSTEDTPTDRRTAPVTTPETLLRLDDGELTGTVSEEVREHFSNGALFSAVVDGGTIRLQEVKVGR